MSTKGKGNRIAIPFIEESSHGWRRFAKIRNNELHGRPTKVLEKFVDQGIEKDWWTPEGLRKSKTFRSLIELCYGKKFLEDLEKRHKEKVKENGESI